MDKKRSFRSIIIAVCVVIVAVCVVVIVLQKKECKVLAEQELCVEPQLMYGIEYEKYDVVDGEVTSGQSLSVIMGNSGVSAQRIDGLNRISDSIFNPRNIRAGKPYHMFFTPDSIHRLEYMVYQQNVTDFVVFDLTGDEIKASKFCKDVTIKRMRNTATVESSLWNCVVGNGMPPGMAADLEEIYAWSVDFFGLQKGDELTVVYDQQMVDSTVIGTGRIWGAIFKHSGKEYYAIPFKQGEKITYWDENGNSLRKNLLKAPLKYSRISSRFSNGRRHPILKIVRPHHAVDYAAPSGTEVHAVADGTVITCGYAGGGGNTIKIKHAGGLQSAYLHLRGYAKGIRTGSHVSQGDLIGYVGSTGLSTGPHLDFRLWRNGTPIDPLKVPSEPTEPISAANKADFDWVKDRIIAEVKGTLVDSLRITQLDSIHHYRNKVDTTNVVAAVIAKN